MLDGLELFGMGYSWGGFESLVIPFDCATYRTATNGSPAAMPCGSISAWRTSTISRRDLDAGFARLQGGGRQGGLSAQVHPARDSASRPAGMPVAAARSRSVLRLAGDQHQVAHVDEDREGLAEDDDEVAPGEAVDQGHQAAADGEEPEADRHDAALGPLARDPLHDEAGRRRRAAPAMPKAARNRTGRRRCRRNRARCPGTARISIRRSPAHSRHPAPAADEPPDAGQIEDADPEPVEQAVIGPARMARPVDHVHMGDPVALALDERRHEAVERVEIRQRQVDVAAERLEAAAGVAGAVLQDAAAHAVGDRATAGS